MFSQYHMIDAEAFIDDDGQVYLYWGSGLNWVNGACFGVKLASDMFTFMGDQKTLHPPTISKLRLCLKEMAYIISCIPMEKLLMQVIKLGIPLGKLLLAPGRKEKTVLFCTQLPTAPLLARAIIPCFKKMINIIFCTIKSYRKTMIMCFANFALTV